MTDPATLTAVIITELVAAGRNDATGNDTGDDDGDGIRHYADYVAALPHGNPRGLFHEY